MKKEILLLAISPKHSNYCVVGYDFESGCFVRLLSKAGTELTSSHLKYENGTFAKVLDVIEVEFLSPAPSYCHQEDWKINTDIPCKFLCKFSKNDLGELCSVENFIFRDILPYLNVEEAKKISKSILLLKIFNVRNHVVVYDMGKMKNKLYFNYNNFPYHGISITDPIYINPSKNICCKEAFALISLADPKEKWCQEHGKCFKFVAQLFPL